MKFPSALTILLFIAALSVISTWLTPAGSYETLLYTSEDDISILNSADEISIFPATHQAFDEPGIKIPLDNFTSGVIYRPVSVPGSFRQVAVAPQGFFALAMSSIKGIIVAADIIFSGADSYACDYDLLNPSGEYM